MDLYTDLYTEVFYIYTLYIVTFMIKILLNFKDELELYTIIYRNYITYTHYLSIFRINNFRILG